MLANVKFQKVLMFLLGFGTLTIGLLIQITAQKSRAAQPQPDFPHTTYLPFVHSRSYVTFVNSEQGYQINYPSTWYIYTSAAPGRYTELDQVLISSIPLDPNVNGEYPLPAGGSGIFVSFVSNQLIPDQSLIDYTNTYLIDPFFGPTDDEATYGDTTFVKMSGELGKLLVAGHGANAYSLFVPIGNDPADQSIIESILASFQPLQETPIATPPGENPFSAGPVHLSQPISPSNGLRATSAPSMKMPWDSGERYRYSGGPHGGETDYWNCDPLPLYGLRGIDFGLKSTDEVLAVADGTITYWADGSNGDGRHPGPGNYVQVDHGGGWITQYWHLSSIDQWVKDNLNVTNAVQQGQVLGRAGLSGNQEAEHLHLHLRNRNTYWHGVSIDGYTVRSIIDGNNDDNGLNYQGTLTRGSESLSGIFTYNCRDVSRLAKKWSSNSGTTIEAGDRQLVASTNTRRYGTVGSTCSGSASEVGVYDLTNCGGGKVTFSNAGLYSLVDSSFNDQAESIEIPVSWSARLYLNDSESSPSDCIPGTDSNLWDNTFSDGLVVANQATWIRVYANSSCSSETPASGDTVTIYENSGNGGTRYGWHDEGQFNVVDYMNDKASSISIADGWSARVFEHDNGNGGKRCFDASDSDFADDTFDNGVAVNDTVSSIEIYHQETCPSPLEPDLHPSAPPGYPYPVVPSSLQGTSELNTLYVNQPTYFDWHFINSGTGTAFGSFYAELWVDNIRYVRYPYSNLDPGWTRGFDDWAETITTAGWHTVRLIIDPENAIAESDETNNTWSMEFYWEPSTPANSPPNFPSNPSPTNNETNQSININLGWVGGDPDGDEVTYDVYLEANDNTPDNLICADVSSAFCDPDALSYGTQYFWRITSTDEHGLSTEGPVWSFTTEPGNNRPNTPSNPSPANNATNQELDVSLSWAGGDPDGDNVEYVVYLEADDTTPDVLICEYISNTSCDPGDLAYETNYYWRVYAQDEHLGTSISPVWNFTTKSRPNNPPLAPSNPSPLNGAVNQTVNADLSWAGGDPDGDTVTYDVYLEANDNTPDNLICNDVSSTFCDPGALGFNTTYYWKVVALDEFGATATGPVWNFSTGSAPTVQFSASSFNVNESAGNASILVTLSGTRDQVVTVHYATSNGSATAGSDYTSVSGTLTFNLGDYAESFSIPIINDEIDESNETINLTLSNPIGAALGTPSVATLTIMDDEAVSCNTITEIPYSECRALEAFYNSTDIGRDWFTNDSPCIWAGITCNGGHIVSLDLRDDLISGSIPPELGDLGFLNFLRLDENYLTGNIPPELGDLSNLQLLRLDHNNLSGTIPSELGNLTDLVRLELQRNQLSGSIPSSLGDLLSLEHLNLSNNELSGGIPPSLGNLSNLQLLFLFGNKLSGNIPAEIGDLTSLNRLDLDNNRLGGDVPFQIENLTNLDWLDIGYNKLTASDASTIDFLDAKDPDWQETQTIPPSNLQASVQSSSCVELTWVPINYTGDGGYYTIHFATSSSGPYSIHGTTNNKSDSGYTACALLSGTTYYFRVRTYTPSHAGQKNELWSDLSEIVAVTTNESMSVGPVVYDGHTIDDDNSGRSSGDGDSQVDCGENIEMSVWLYNQGTDNAERIYAYIDTDDPYVVDIVDPEPTDPDIPGGDRVLFPGMYFEVVADTPDSHVITFDLYINDDNGNSWSDTFTVPVSCDGTVVVLDTLTADGNWNQKSTFVPGDPIQWIISVENTTGATVDVELTYDVEGPNGESVYYWNGLVTVEPGQWWWGLPGTVGRGIIGAHTFTGIADYQGTVSQATANYLVRKPTIGMIEAGTGGGLVPVYPYERLVSLGYQVTLLPVDAGIDTFSQYDIVYLPTNWADGFSGNYSEIEAQAADYRTYVNGGGSLFVDQPNPYQQTNESVTPTLLPYPITFYNRGTADDWPPVIVNPSHYITQGLPDSDMPGPSDQITELDPAYEILVQGRSTASPSVVVAIYGQGRLLVQTAHPSEGFSDEVYHRMIEWVSSEAGSVISTSILSSPVPLRTQPQ